VLRPEDYAVVGESIIEKLRAAGSRVGALAVSSTHCHALIEVGHGDAVMLFGKAKQFVSHRMRDRYPGKLWGASSHVVRMRDESQVETVRRYILAHRDEGAWVWPLR
jgi:REP element-mobilizing transposase RayT